MLVHLYLLLLIIIVCRHNRYSGSRYPIKIIHKKINLSHEITSEIRHQSDTKKAFKRKLLNRLRLEARNWNAFFHVFYMFCMFSVVTDKYLLNGHCNFVYGKKY